MQMLGFLIDMDTPTWKIDELEKRYKDYLRTKPTLFSADDSSVLYRDTGSANHLKIAFYTVSTCLSFPALVEGSSHRDIIGGWASVICSFCPSVICCSFRPSPSPIGFFFLVSLALLSFFYSSLFFLICSNTAQILPKPKTLYTRVKSSEVSSRQWKSWALAITPRQAATLCATGKAPTCRTSSQRHPIPANMLVDKVGCRRPVKPLSLITALFLLELPRPPPPPQQYRHPPSVKAFSASKQTYTLQLGREPNCNVYLTYHTRHVNKET